MRLTKKLTMTLLILMVATSYSWAQKNGKISPMEVELADEPAIIIGEYKVTISEAIKTAIEKNRDLLSGAYDLAMTDSDYKRYLAKYSTIFQAEGGITTVKNPELYWADYPKTQKSTDISASLAKNFETGTTLSAGYSQSIFRNKWANPAYPKNVYQPQFFASIQQELMKNSFGYTDRREQKMLKNAKKIGDNQIKYGLSVIVVGVIADYWDLVVKKIHMNNSNLMLRETKRVRNIVAGNVRLGLSEKFMLNYWNALVSSSEASLASAQQNYRDALRKFLQDINMDPETTLEGKAILSDKFVIINQEEALKTAFAKRVDYNNALLQLENAKYQFEIYRNHALPSLKGSVTASTGDYVDDFDESYQNTMSLKYPRVDARVTFTYPLNDTNQKTNERNAQWQLKQQELQVNKYKRIVKDEIKSRTEQISTNYKLYKKAQQGRYQAQAYYTRLLRSLRRGRFTASDVRDGLDGLINSREAELQTLVLYNISLLQFKVSKNVLFEDFGIDVNKYIPKK